MQSSEVLVVISLDSGEASIISQLSAGGKALDDRVILGFPGGPVVKNPPCSAGGHRFDPWSRKIPRAMEQLSLCTKTIESVFWSSGAATIEVHVP